MSESLEKEYILNIEAHEGIIHKVIGLYIDHDQDREDMYQEVLLQAWKSYKNFQGHSRFSTWLYKVTLNTVLNFQKKKRIQETEITEAQNVQQEEKVKSNEHEVLYRIIKAMNEVDKMLITLHLDGYKNIEISEITGMTQNNINVKLHRIKTAIIEQFKKP